MTFAVLAIDCAGVLELLVAMAVVQVLDKKAL